MTWRGITRAIKRKDLTEFPAKKNENKKWANADKKSEN